MAKIQAQWRMFTTRRLFRQKKAAQIKISAEWKMWKCKCHYQKMRNAAIVIQSYQRGMEARKLLKEYLTHSKPHNVFRLSPRPRILSKLRRLAGISRKTDDNFPAH